MNRLFLTADKIAITVIASITLFGSCLKAQSQYQITTFDVPASAATFPAAIDNNGRVVGDYQTTDQSGNVIYRGFQRAPDGTITDVIPPGTTGYYNDARGVNTNLIVGTYFDASNVNHGYIYDGEHYVTLDIQGDPTSLVAISNSGLIAGAYSPDPQQLPVSFLRSRNGLLPIMYPGSTFTYPLGVNIEGEAVGTFGDPSGSVQGYFFSPARGYQQVVFPGSSETFPNGINDAGVIVGNYYDAGRYIGFIRKGGTFYQLIVLQSGYTSPAAINDPGDITGYYQDSQGVDHGFLATLVQ